ncbi:MAG: HAD family phosphatase [Clostridia bacterium]|nr:HAD family phosphatase [Clostridia bacterium]
MIKNVIFDVMGVVFVVGDDTNDLLVPFVNKINNTITKEKINNLYLDASLGKITSREFWLNIGIEESEIQNIEKKYLDENLIIDSKMIDVIKLLKAKGYKIGFLSNDVSEWSNYLRKKYKLTSLLDYCVISGDVGLRKPDESIYNYLIQEYNVIPKESIFIDDRIKNLIPAENLGFNTILFDRDNRYNNLSCNKINNCFEIINIIEKLDKA